MNRVVLLVLLASVFHAIRGQGDSCKCTCPATKSEVLSCRASFDKAAPAGCDSWRSTACSSCPSSGRPIFSGALGFRVYTPACRGGRVYGVTNLKNSGTGSLRNAMEARCIIFEISCTVWLDRDISVNHPYMTVAGQATPKPGITLARAGISIRTHDILIQHLRVRIGDTNVCEEPQDRDGIQVVGRADGSRGVYNVVIDHCSISWAIDESVSTWYRGVWDITFSNNIISEALDDSKHPKGPHSKGFLIGDHSKRIACQCRRCAWNLFAHNADRNPLVKGDVTAAIMNNVVYNAKYSAIHFGDLEHSGPSYASVVGNVLLRGRDSGSSGNSIKLSSNTHKKAEVFVKDLSNPSDAQDVKKSLP